MNDQPQAQDSIFAIIRKEIDDYVFNQIEIVPGYVFSTYLTIQRCHLYFNSQFQNKTLYQNRERLFFNVVKDVCILTAKMLDIDTKDIKLYPLNPESDFSTFLLEKELKTWMKENGVNKVLNQIAEEAPIYGSVVLKKTKKGAKVVDLRRFFLDPTVEYVKDSRFVTIKHYMSVSELRAKIKDGWDKTEVERIIRQHRERTVAPQSYERTGMVNQVVSSPLIEVYERYGEIEKKYFYPETIGKRDENDILRTLMIVAEPYEMDMNTQGQETGDAGAILFKSEWAGAWPFKDYHYQKTRGRWLGVGVIEDLFPDQERQNEMANQKRISMEVSGMQLFQSKDKTVVSNILTDLESGDILFTEGIEPITTEERNLQAFAQEQELYQDHSQRMTFAYPGLQGDPLPASTTATAVVTQTNNAQSVFGFKRENLGIMLQDFFNEFVLPACLKDLNADHMLSYIGGIEDISKLDELAADTHAKTWAFDTMLSGHVVTQAMYQTAKQKALQTYKKNGNRRFVDIKKGMYKDIEFEFDIIVTGEQENVTVMAQNMFQIITAIGQNPNLLTNPVSKVLLYQYAEKIGIPAAQLEAAESQAQNMPQPQQPQPQQQAQPRPQVSAMQPQQNANANMR